MCHFKLIKFNSGENESRCPEAVLPDAEERPAEVVCSSVSFVYPLAEAETEHFSGTMSA